MSFSTRHIDYLTRNFLEELSEEPSDLQARIMPPSNIGLVKVVGIPRIWEKHKEMVVSTRELMRDVIAGLRGMMMPIVYLLLGEANRVSVYLGTFSQGPNASQHLRAICSILTSAYPGIEFEEDKNSGIKTHALTELAEKLSSLKNVAVVIGTPTSKVGTEEIGVEQVERLVRGLYGRQWAYLVVAIPISVGEVTRAYNDILSEMKAISDAEASTKTKNPIATRYRELLKVYAKKLEAAKAQGAWETCAYVLCNDETLLSQAEGIVVSVFGGSKSVPDHIRAVRANRAAQIAQSMGYIITPAPRGPGSVQYRYKYMSTLSSADLSSMVHLPTSEMPGYFVKSYARFDVFPHRDHGTNAVEVGEVLDEGKPIGCEYTLGLGDLNKHCLIVGTTGSGKTNTVFHLLKQLWQMQEPTPFLVIEPTKTEYRKLLASKELGSELQVFTLGDENTSPFRLNPFELLPGVSVQTHIDHLKSVFGASFVMWAPMPHVLERSIHEIYEDKGWRLVENSNPRGKSPNAFPTMSDLYEKIDEVVNRLGYEEKVTMDVQAALKTRIDSLRIGGKGLMLNVRRGIPFEKLMSRPTILELEAVADDDEKAFLMGLFLVFMQEYYVARGLIEGTPLRHITVIEEAHRLLAHVARGLDSEVANTKWKAVETFTNILSEVRAYGEGFIVAEQIPTKLSPDIVKNTNLKIMHRIVSDEDRRVMGGAMNLDDQKSRRVVSFAPGEATVFSEGDDAPFNVRVPYSKIRGGAGEDRSLVTDRMQHFRDSLREIYVGLDDCVTYCRTPGRYRTIAEKIVVNPLFRQVMSRFVLSIVADPPTVLEGYGELKSTMKELMSGFDDAQGVALCTFIHAADRHFERRGEQYQWNYSETSKLKTLFVDVVNALLVNDGGLTGGEIPADELKRIAVEELVPRLTALRTAYVELTKGRQPYENLCSLICTDGACLYRFANKELLQKQIMIDRFEKALAQRTNGQSLEDAALEESRSAISRTMCEHVDPETRNKAALCYALQFSQEMWQFETYERQRFMERILAASQGNDIVSGTVGESGG